jgi:hypothetical protein
VKPIQVVLLDAYCTLVDVSDSVLSSGSDEFARLGLPLVRGEFYRLYVQLINEDEPDYEGTASFALDQPSWTVTSHIRCVQNPCPS